MFENKTNLCRYMYHLNDKLEFGIDTSYVTDYEQVHVGKWSRDKHYTNSAVQLVSIVHHLNGSLSHVGHFNLQNFFLCENEYLKHSKLVFGVNVRKTCTWTVNRLWDYAQQPDHATFYELFSLFDSDKLYPVPVKGYLNEQTDRRLFMRRFYLVNSQIGMSLQ